jgi:hypothetical protein
VLDAYNMINSNYLQAISDYDHVRLLNCCRGFERMRSSALDLTKELSWSHLSEFRQNIMQSCKNCVTCKMLSDITVITGNDVWLVSCDHVTMMSMMLIGDWCDIDHVEYMSSKKHRGSQFLKLTVIKARW